MAYLGKNYERDFQLDFLNYLSKLKDNGSLTELVLKKDNSKTGEASEAIAAKAQPARSWLRSKQYQIAETLLLSGTKG